MIFKSVPEDVFRYASGIFFASGNLFSALNSNSVLSFIKIFAKACFVFKNDGEMKFSKSSVISIEKSLFFSSECMFPILTFAEPKIPKS